MIEKPTDINPESYVAQFISLAKGNDLIESLLISKNEIIDLIGGIDNSKANFAYEKDKWTIKQVLKHISDSERIHSYRALRFSKNDGIDLPGFDENIYAEQDNSENLNLGQIKNEFIAVRNATIELYRLMHIDSYDYYGRGNKLELTPRIIGWIISGHSTHHCTVIRERYL